MEKVLEKLGTTESATLSVSREVGGKIRLTSLLWPEPKVILKGEVLEVPNVDDPAPCRGSPGTTTTRTSGRAFNDPCTTTDKVIKA
jgi:hypothetical protein